MKSTLDWKMSKFSFMMVKMESGNFMKTHYTYQHFFIVGIQQVANTFSIIATNE